MEGNNQVNNYQMLLSSVHSLKRSINEVNSRYDLLFKMNEIGQTWSVVIQAVKENRISENQGDTLLHLLASIDDDAILKYGSVGQSKSVQIDDADMLIPLTNHVVIVLNNAKNNNELNNCIAMANKVIIYVKKSMEHGNVNDNDGNRLYSLLIHNVQYAAERIERLKEYPKPQNTNQNIDVYNEIAESIDKIIDEINETTDEDDLNTLRRKTVQISESLLDRNIRSKLSSLEIHNIEEQIAEMLRVIRNKIDLEEEIRSRRGAL